MFGIHFDNPWIRTADQARRPISAWLTAIIAALASTTFLVGGQALARSVTPVLFQSGATGLGDAISMSMVFYLCVFGPFHGFSFAMLRLVERRPRPDGWIAGRAVALGLSLGLGGLAASLAIAAAAHVLVGGGGAPTGAGAIGGVAAALALFAFQVGAEEVFFRGWLQPRLCASWGAWIGVLATATLFAAMHLIGTPLSGAAIANLLLGGLLFGLLALRTGGLWAPFAAHLAWNWTESSVVGLQPNPGLGPLGALFDLDLDGPRLWSGGSEGLNGSFAASIVLATLVAGLAVARQRRA